MPNRNQNFPIFRCNSKLLSEQKCRMCQQHDMHCNYQECFCEEWPEMRKRRFKDSRKMKLIKFYEAKIIVDCDQNHISNFLFSQARSRNCPTPKCALVLADKSEYKNIFLKKYKKVVSSLKDFSATANLIKTMRKFDWEDNLTEIKSNQSTRTYEHFQFKI